jgi:hypothetical protein
MKKLFPIFIFFGTVLSAKAQSAYHGGKGDGYASAGVSSITLSLNETDAGFSVWQVYPNPVQKGQLLMISYTSQSAFQAILLDATGRQVLPAINLSPAQHQYNLPLAVQPGVYILRCSSDASISEQKIVVY